MSSACEFHDGWQLTEPANLSLAMAAATSLAAIASGGGTGGPSPASSSRIQEERPSIQRIRVSTPREQRRAIWGSGFLGQLELRGALGGREAGSVGGRNLRLRRRTVGVARAGLPVVSSIPVLGPVFNAFLNPVVVFILYAAGGKVVAELRVNDDKRIFIFVFVLDSA